MFTGIIEGFGLVKKLVKDNENLHITLESDLTSELKVDQSIAHNGVCLTVVAIKKNEYTITAIKESLEKTTLNDLQLESKVNLERAIKLGNRLDGHLVQGHIDQVGVCTQIKETGGSWYYTFEYNPSQKNITIEKGSITINGVSLTVVNSGISNFSVAIIPYTYKHTNFHLLRIGTRVNLEFDIIGKYIIKMQLLN